MKDERTGTQGTKVPDTLEAFTPDELDWLNWFLGMGAGAAMRDKRDEEHKDMILQRSMDLVNKLGAWRELMQDGVNKGEEK
jgi:hypothetical protein